MLEAAHTTTDSLSLHTPFVRLVLASARASLALATSSALASPPSDSYTSNQHHPRCSHQNTSNTKDDPTYQQIVQFCSRVLDLSSQLWKHLFGLINRSTLSHLQVNRPILLVGLVALSDLSDPVSKTHLLSYLILEIFISTRGVGRGLGFGSL